MSPNQRTDQKPDSKKFYVTTPIYYVNARPHIGHAYTTIVADVLARRHRLLGDDTFFLTGTDEHGQKIERSAAAAGIPPQQFTDEVSKQFRTLWDRMGLTYNRYIRTTDPAHKRGAQKLFTDLYHRGAIYLSSYTGQYSIGEEMFVEGPPGTLGPDGRPTETVTEENFFFRLSDYQRPLLDLIELDILKITPETSKNEVLSFLRGDVAGAERSARPLPLPSGLEYPSAEASSRPEAQSAAEPSSRPEAHSTAEPSSRPKAQSTAEPSSRPEAQSAAVERPLSSAPAQAPGNPQPHDPQSQIAYSDMGHAYVPGTVRDLSVSRSSFTWGIPVPEAIQREAEVTGNHIIYVWLDALANYMTAVGYGDPSPEAQAEFARLWPADLHLVGKEITRFHCVYWPAFLLAAGLPLPKQITANGWLLFDNAKMSKSRGNIVRTETILDAFGDHVYGKQFPDSTKAERDLFASDVLRYFLLREIPFGQDGSFSFDALVTRYNADLVNGYGNLVSRTLTLIANRLSNTVPPLPSEPYLIQDTRDFDPVGDGTIKVSTVIPGATSSIVKLGPATVTVVNELFPMAEYSRLLDWGIFNQVRATDVYITANTPWKLNWQHSGAERDKLQEILYTAAESIRIITALLYPILPHATAKVWAQLGLGDIEQAAKSGQLNNLEWGGLQSGTKLGPLAPIFPRADKGLAQIMIDMEETRSSAAQLTQNLPTSPLMTEQSPTSPAIAPSTTAPNQPADTLPNAGATAETSTAPTPSPAGPTDAEPQIAIDDFIKIELRVAQILIAERIPKADKLLRLEVDLGYEKRQILSGIAQWYTPEELIGRRIAIVANLAPRKMRGLESHGMLLAASAGHDDKPMLASFSDDIALGARVR